MTTGVTTPLRILVLGASYGVILGMRIAAAGHRVTFVCREQEAALINAKKLFLRIPAKDRTLPVEISASQCPRGRRMPVCLATSIRAGMT